jgi:hypothetical protein
VIYLLATGVLFLVRDKIVEGPLLEKFQKYFLTTKLNYGTKKYSSYDQIDRELEILKIEKEISYQKNYSSIIKLRKALHLNI